MSDIKDREFDDLVETIDQAIEEQEMSDLMDQADEMQEQEMSCDCRWRGIRECNECMNDRFHADR